MATKIEWMDETWNPITGCTPISPGCDHCYAKRMANRLRGRFGYPADDPFQVAFHRDKLDQPLRWHKPRTIFVCSMSDLWHQEVTEGMRRWVFNQVEVAAQHRYLFLTKRPERIEYFPDLPNCGLGVTVENTDYLWRIEKLLKIPAAMRFVSGEPLLGPLILPSLGFTGPQTMVDWVIAGGETGPGARPMHPDWVRSIQGQCQVAEVPFFFKGWGEWGPKEGMEDEEIQRFVAGHATRLHTFPDWTQMIRVGKKQAGRLLDGREWNEFPEWHGAAEGK